MTAEKLSVQAFASRLSEKFPILMREILRYENNYLTRGVITPPQFWVLSRLVHQGPCQMGELAAHLNLKFSSATGLVDRLVRQSVVRRGRTEKDRRAVLVTLTAKGRRIYRQICHQKRQGIARLFARLTASERKRYLDIVEKLVRRLAGEP